MKSRCSRIMRGLSVVAVGLGMGGLAPRAAERTVLAVDLYAGLKISGVPGEVYSIECLTDLSRAGSVRAWRCLEYFQLPATPYVWTDTSAPATGQRLYRAVKVEPPARMVFVPPGTFRMGSPETETGRLPFESPQTTVTFSQGFWIGKFEVTQAEYEALMGGNPSAFVGSERPVESVSWTEAAEYCARLTQQERQAGRIAAASSFRLPTEAEWEYACRALTSTPFGFDADPAAPVLGDYAWYNANSAGETHPVGQKLPNPWGLHDVHGNVAEWCQDWLGAYPGGSVTDPPGPAMGATRVVRGGSWENRAVNCRSAVRFGAAPDQKDNRVGFRVVLAPTTALLRLESVASRKSHGTIGELDHPLPIDRPYGVEPRLGRSQTIVFLFNKDVTAGTAHVQAGSAELVGVTMAGRQLIVQLSNVPDRQWLTLRLSDVADQNGGVIETLDVTFGVLEGDVDGNGQVNSADVQTINAKVGAPVSALNCVYDLNLNGGISSVDVLETNRRLGGALPPSP